MSFSVSPRHKSQHSLTGILQMPPTCGLQLICKRGTQSYFSSGPERRKLPGCVPGVCGKLALTHAQLNLPGHPKCWNIHTAPTSRAGKAEAVQQARDLPYTARQQPERTTFPCPSLLPPHCPQVALKLTPSCALVLQII